jgi:two-component system, OmpR family, response regulator VicR
MRYLTTGEVASRCQVSVGTVKNWIDAGKLEAFRTPGRHFRVRASELRRFQAAFGFGAESDESPKILVVDDQQDFVDLALDALRDLVPGARVEGVCGGYEALLRIGSFQPHLLVLDLRMPGLDGFEVCRRVKEAPASKGTKILAMTGFEDDQAEQLALTCGADAFVSKRAGLATLGRWITSLLEADPATDVGAGPRAAVSPPRARAGRTRPARPARTARRAGR